MSEIPEQVETISERLEKKDCTTIGAINSISVLPGTTPDEDRAKVLIVGGLFEHADGSLAKKGASPIADVLGLIGWLASSQTITIKNLLAAREGTFTLKVGEGLSPSAEVAITREGGRKEKQIIKLEALPNARVRAICSVAAELAESHKVALLTNADIYNLLLKGSPEMRALILADNEPLAKFIGQVKSAYDRLLPGEKDATTAVIRLSEGLAAKKKINKADWALLTHCAMFLRGQDSDDNPRRWEIRRAIDAIDMKLPNTGFFKPFTYSYKVDNSIAMARLEPSGWGAGWTGLADANIARGPALIAPVSKGKFSLVIGPSGIPGVMIKNAFVPMDAATLASPMFWTQFVKPEKLGSWGMLNYPAAAMVGGGPMGVLVYGVQNFFRGKQASKQRKMLEDAITDKDTAPAKMDGRGMALVSYLSMGSVHTSLGIFKTFHGPRSWANAITAELSAWKPGDNEFTFNLGKPGKQVLLNLNEAAGFLAGCYLICPEKIVGDKTIIANKLNELVPHPANDYQGTTLDYLKTAYAAVKGDVSKGASKESKLAWGALVAKFVDEESRGKPNDATHSEIIKRLAALLGLGLNELDGERVSARKDALGSSPAWFALNWVTRGEATIAYNIGGHLVDYFTAKNDDGKRRALEGVLACINLTNPDIKKLPENAVYGRLQAWAEKTKMDISNRNLQQQQTGTRQAR